MLLLRIFIVCGMVVALPACLNGGSGGNTATSASSVKDGYGVVQFPLQVNGYTYSASTAQYFVPGVTDNGNFVAVVITNNNSMSVANVLKSAPTLSGNGASAYTLANASGDYPAGYPMCQTNTVLSAHASCMLSIQEVAIANGSANLALALGGFAPQTVNFSLTSSGSTYYIAGNFSSANLPTSTTSRSSKLGALGINNGSVSASNSGNCGSSTGTQKACLILSYNPITGQVKKIAETDDEVYALTYSNGSLYVGGALTQLATNTNVASMIAPGTAGVRSTASLIGQINLSNNQASQVATANNAVYTITQSDPASSDKYMYFGGAFTTIYNKDNPSSQLASNNQQCLITQLDNGGGWHNIMGDGNGANGTINSLATLPTPSGSALSGHDQLYIAGAYSQLGNGLNLASGNGVGLVSCSVNGTNSCNTNAAGLQLNGWANLVTTANGQLYTSGQYTKLNGVSGSTSNSAVQVNPSASINQNWNQQQVVSGANNTINTILPLNTSNGSTNIVGGFFSQVNNVGEPSNTGAGNCGQDGNSACILAAVDSSNNVQELLATNSSINAIAAGPGSSISISKVR